jgi:hypothetical protein
MSGWLMQRALLERSMKSLHDLQRQAARCRVS